MNQSNDTKTARVKRPHVIVMAGCLTLGTFLALPYAHLIKGSSEPVLDLISIDQTDWQVPPQLPVPEAKVVEDKTILPKPDLMTVREDIVPLKVFLDFELGALDVGGDFDVSFSVNPQLGAVGSYVFELGDIDSAPQPLVQLRPHYPAHARMRQVEGNVVVIFVVSTNGRTENIRILSSSSDGIFDRAAGRAIERWRFSPGTLDGKPVAVQVRQNIRFELQ